MAEMPGRQENPDKKKITKYKLRSTNNMTWFHMRVKHWRIINQFQNLNTEL